MKKIIVAVLISLVFIQGLGAKETITLTLPEALTLAAKQNPSVLISAARVQMALARIDQARAGLLPEFNGVVAGSRQTRDLRSGGIAFPGTGPEIGPFNSYDARLRLSLSLFDVQMMGRFKAAKRQKELSKAQADRLKEDVLVLVAHLYLNAKQSARHAQHSKALLERDQLIYTKAKEQLKQGQINDIDLAQAKSQLLQSKYIVTQAKQQALEDRLDLLAALGIPDNKDIIFRDSTVLTLNKEKQSPLIIEAQAQVAAAKAQTFVSEMGHAPKITGIADMGYAGEGFNDDSRVYSIGLQATIPLWQGGLTQAKIKEAKAMEAESAINLADVKQRVAFDIVASEKAIQQSRRYLAYRSHDVKTKQKELDLIKVQVDQGLKDQVALKKMIADMALAQDDYDQARALYQMAEITLAYAKGSMNELMLLNREK